MIEAIARRLGGVLTRVVPLKGGVSADVRLLEVETLDGMRRVVLRRAGAGDVKPEHVPDFATEFALLEALHRQGFPVPEPLWHGDGHCVMAYVPSDDTPPDVEQMADLLACMHRLDPADLPALPPSLDAVPDVFAYLPERHADLRALLTPTPVERQALVHGDYWAGNLLWRDGRIAALIDWEDATLGDPLSDLATARLELSWRMSVAAADAFTARYVAAMGGIDRARLARWALLSACGALAFADQWGLAPEALARLKFTADAVADEAAARLRAAG